MNRFAAGIWGVSLLAIISACSTSAPKCADQKTIDLVLKIAQQEFDKKVGSQIRKEIADKFSMALGAIRTTGAEEKTGAQACAAELILKNPMGEDKLNITYKSEKTDNGEHYVTVFGL